MPPDIDTSSNFDPSPTRDELLRIRDRMNARLDDDGRVRDYGRPVRIIRSANLLTRYWQQDVDHLERKMIGLGVESQDLRRCYELAETGKHLGLERVGLVVGVEEVSP